MTRIGLLLFGLLALGCSQIIYPDQYEIMVKMTAPPYVHTTPPAGRASEYDKQFNTQSDPQYSVSEQAAPARPIYYTTRAPYYPSTTLVPSQSLPQDWNRVNDIIARGLLKFSLNLDRAIDNTEIAANNYHHNIIFSPLSMATALSLVLLGAGGKTFDEVAQILGLENSGIDISLHSEVFHQMFGRMLDTVNYRDKESNSPRVNSASGIFVQDGYPIRYEFRTISQNIYKSEVINLDFARKGKEAKDIINEWVKQQTMGKINTILSDVPSPLTTVILASALYFNGEWNQHFLEGATKRKPFFIEPNNAVEIDMMYNGGLFPFYEDKSLGVKLLALPYKGQEMSMYVLLPKEEGATALKNFRNRLTPEIIENLINNLKNQTCIIGMPRMKLSSSLGLKDTLENMGLRSLFNPAIADLSLLSGGSQQAPIASAARPISQTFSQAAQAPITSTPLPILQALPQALPQVAPQGIGKSMDNDVLIFSRFPEINPNQDIASGIRRNYFRYDDKQRGVIVEQWRTGFHIQKIRRIRTRRDIIDGHNNGTSRVTYAGKNNDLQVDGSKFASEGLRDHEDKRYLSLKENKYRFRNLDKQHVDETARKKRQIRPMNSPYGLDDLRNSANLVNPGLYADQVLHKVEMEVTERGTEAAAATSVILERDGNQKRLVANRPFLFFIRHDPTKLILFWGTVNLPTPNYAIAR